MHPEAEPNKASAQGNLKRFWIGSAICCFALAALEVVTLLATHLTLKAVLSTSAFLAAFMVSGILYLMRRRHVIKAMWVVLAFFFLGAAAYWLNTGQFIGVLPSVLIVLLVWQNGRLEKVQQITAKFYEDKHQTEN